VLAIRPARLHNPSHRAECQSEYDAARDSPPPGMLRHRQREADADPMATYQLIFGRGQDFGSLLMPSFQRTVVHFSSLADRPTFWATGDGSIFDDFPITFKIRFIAPVKDALQRSATATVRTSRLRACRSDRGYGRGCHDAWNGKLAACPTLNGR